MKKPALILAVNTASLDTSIALLEKTGAMAGTASVKAKLVSVKILAEKSWKSSSNEAEKLMPEIFALLKQCKNHSFNRVATFADLKEIYVIKGPGSFTGLRIGITVANTIAYLNGCQLFAISTFEYWRSLSPLPILIYAGSGGVYLHENSTTQLINLKDLNKTLRAKKIKTVFGDITAEQKAVLKNVQFIDFGQNFGKSFGSIIAEFIQKIKSVKIVEPLYVKQPAISISKKLICST